MSNRLSKVQIRWSEAFAYAIGLIATDGNLSSDQRHINFTNKDLELVEKFRDSLGLSNKIGRKSRGGEIEKKYYVIQFGDVNFYRFLLRIGLTPAKSLTISQLDVPQKFFRHFLRGCIDGDGNISVANHPESIHKQLRVRIYSSSLAFLNWLLTQIQEEFCTSGGWIDVKNYSKVYALMFAKEDGVKILKGLYRGSDSRFLLSRKFLVAEPFLGG